MKSLRVIALMLALGALPIFSMQAFGQQEVSPDHFDQEPAAQAAAKSAKAQNHHQSAHAQAQHHNANLASNHSHKAKHHHASA